MTIKLVTFVFYEHKFRFLLSRTGASNSAGTVVYQAPEILLGTKEYGHSVDIWSLGCIFAELFKLEPLFKQADKITMLWNIFEMVGGPDISLWNPVDACGLNLSCLPTPSGFESIRKRHKDFDSSAEDLLWRMLSPDPWRRPSCQDILSHPFLSRA